MARLLGVPQTQQARGILPLKRYSAGICDVKAAEYTGGFCRESGPHELRQQLCGKTVRQEEPIRTAAGAFGEELERGACGGSHAGGRYGELM
jgi:hypothetical protein